MNGGKWRGSDFILLRVFPISSAARSDLGKVLYQLCFFVR
nr:MAG TPA_asm: hypothetical protein [Caudoviricetes sp.]